jgi:hypothetical protein
MHAFYNGARATRPLLVDVGESPSVGGRGRVAHTPFLQCNAGINSVAHNAACCIFYNGARATRPLMVDVGDSPTLLFHSAMLGSTQSLITLLAAFFIMERGRPALCWVNVGESPTLLFHSAMLGSTQSLITLLAAFFIMERGRVALCWVDVGESPTLLFHSAMLG